MVYCGDMSNKTTSKSKSTRPKRLLFLKMQLVLYSILGGIVAFILIFGVIVPTYQNISLKLEVSHDTRTYLKAYNNEISRGYNDEISQVKQLMQIDTVPVYSVLYNGCNQGTIDAGWMVSSYTYSCQLNYVSFFDVPAIASSYIASVAAPLETEPDAYKNGPAHYLDDYLSAIGAKLSQSDETYNLSLLGTTDANELISNLALDIPSYYDKHEVLYESGSSKLDPAKRYIVLSDVDSYYYKNLGCSHPRVIFCESPL